MSTAENNVAAAAALADALFLGGVRDACLSPGSRSSPLALAFDAHDGIALHMITDERSSGFFALGIAKASLRPVVVGCTSGTAAANLMPAFIEASLAGSSLIALTADRPPELRDVGAAQTIRQTGLFSNHSLWSTDAPVPSDFGTRDEVTSVFSSLGVRLVETATAGTGCTHANLPFREPLFDETATATLDALRSSPPCCARSTVVAAVAAPTAGNIELIATALAEHRNGIIVAGPHTGHDELADSIVQCAAALGWPILADPLCGLRYSRRRHSTVIEAYDIFLRNDATCARLRPDAIVRVGAPPTSKVLNQAISEWRPTVNVLSAPRGNWPDPARTATHIVRGESGALFLGITRHAQTVARHSDWLESWRSIDGRTRTIADHALRATFFEATAIRQIVDALVDGETLVLGNSMPIRDADAFCPSGNTKLLVHGNRGANGIDGLLSTSLGIHERSPASTTLILGDLSFLHDLGALQLTAGERPLSAKSQPHCLTIVVINNNGGGIFGFLPRPRSGLEHLFTTPHGLDLEPWIRAAGLPFARADCSDSLKNALQCSRTAAVRVIEVRVDREANVAARNAALTAAARSPDEDKDSLP